ncbi:MAG TPA: DUF2460 domain-containing protein [Candidatus Angelobacter sp.]|jgi:uncharacterized protein (TIGR02217 family)
MKKTPVWNTIEQLTTAFQGSVWIAGANFPKWKFVISLPQVLGRADDVTSPISQLLALHFRAKGKCGNFLLRDPSDYQAVAAQFGVGDSVSKTFQLVRPIGTDGDVDIVQNPNGPIVVSVSGTPTSAYSLSNTGIVTFNVAPAANAVLTWDGFYDFRVKFAEDSLDDLTLFFDNQWVVSTIELFSVIL